MKKIILSGLFPEEICEKLNISQQFRGKQIFKWISKGVSDFSQMTNLSSALREELSQKAEIFSSKIGTVLKDPDGTIKLQILLEDDFAVETVLLTDSKNRKTACVSCQVGCPMNCAFCQTGKIGFARNLTCAEIVEQFLFLEKEAGRLPGSHRGKRQTNSRAGQSRSLSRLRHPLPRHPLRRGHRHLGLGAPTGVHTPRTAPGVLVLSQRNGLRALRKHRFPNL